jgi:hypothetical protein
MASTLLGGLARVHQGGDRRGGEGGEGAYEGKSDDGLEACHGEVADGKRAGTGVGRVVAGVWQSSSARHTTRGSRGRRFGGAMVALTGAGSPCHSIIIYTPSLAFVCPAYPSLADRLLLITRPLR